MIKKQKIVQMFDNIAGSYDFLNHFLSMGVDIYWRRKAVKILGKTFVSWKDRKILDVATGTGDFAIEALKLNPEKIIGIDISEKMLARAKEKIKKLPVKNKIKFLLADCENLPFENNYFDAVTVGFGVRNFENFEKGLFEMYRVLKKSGIVIILEFSRPKTFPIKNIFNFYFKNILPNIGKIISKDKEAYIYLPQSVQKFPDGEEFLNIMKNSGFSHLQQIPLTFGIASIYIGRKP